MLACSYALIATGPFLLALLMKTHSFSPAREMGLALGLLGFPVLALQPVLASRVRAADRAFGLNTLYVFHKTMAMLAGCLLIAHPFLLAADPAIGWNLLTSVKHPWFILLGQVSLLALAALLVTSLLRKELHLSYERWRSAHNALAVVVLAGGFIHSFYAGSDLQRWPMRTLWMLLAVLTAAAYACHKLIGPRQRRAHPFRIAGVSRENRQVWTLTLAPAPGVEGLDYLPGQFQFLTFRSEEHPFTISSSPTTTGGHSATIKESGDFTSGIGRLQVGDSVGVQGPFGRFSYLLYPDEEDLVFIGGGIGITPLIGMLRHMRDTAARKKAILLWGNRTEEDILFREELDGMAAAVQPALRVVHVLSRPGPAWKGERGRVDLELIRRYAPSFADGAAFYICGPPAMIDSLASQLNRAGTPPAKLHTERFDL
ncbi:MAG: hypothetical protein A2X46_13040 [Lentisphaerae bacterium GWF2_57_35]|nr:MAG: hypothetical protein A2X46_13040 [Lentisphaerae bacterium GWF2_57_35]